MAIAIRTRWTDKVLYSSASSKTIKEALLGALTSGSDLRGSDLSGSDLGGSDLSGSDLSGSDLRGSNLSDSNLRGSDLSGSNLSGSNLSGSNLSGSDLVFHLPSVDPRGYSAHGCCTSGQWLLHAGCRVFTADAAREHWGDPEYPDRERGDDYLEITVPYFEKQVATRMASAG